MPTLVHITDRPVERWSNQAAQLSGQYRIERRGKPAGFWYAYENEWRKFYYKNTHTETLYKYTVDVPSRFFTTDIDATGATTILRLTPANIQDFVRHYVARVGRDALRTDPLARLYELILEDVQQGAGHFDELREGEDYEDYEFADFLEELFERAGEGEEEADEEDEEDNEENKNEEVSAREAAKRARIAYQILADIGDEGRDAFQWPVFWDAVRTSLGGVEFSAEFFEGGGRAAPPLADDIDLSWVKSVELRSGVIFKPRTFFATAGVCPTLTHLFTKKERARLKTVKGKRRRELLRNLMTRKGRRERVRAPACG